jgi:hypothetical protein
MDDCNGFECTGDCEDHLTGCPEDGTCGAECGETACECDLDSCTFDCDHAVSDREVIWTRRTLITFAENTAADRPVRGVVVPDEYLAAPATWKDGNLNGEKGSFSPIVNPIMGFMNDARFDYYYEGFGDCDNCECVACDGECFPCGFFVTIRECVCLPCVCRPIALNQIRNIQGHVERWAAIGIEFAGFGSTTNDGAGGSYIIFGDFFNNYSSITIEFEVSDTLTTETFTANTVNLVWLNIRDFGTNQNGSGYGIAFTAPVNANGMGILNILCLDGISVFSKDYYCGCPPCTCCDCGEDRFAPAA